MSHLQVALGGGFAAMVLLVIGLAKVAGVH